MEKLLYTFKSIKKFSINNIINKPPKFDHCVELTLDLELENGSKHSLVLIKPFLPFGRAKKHLEYLESLSHEDIDHIKMFDGNNDKRCEKKPRVEIWMKDGVELTLSFERIKGLSKIT